MDTLTVVERRRNFVRHLYGLHYGLSSNDPRRSADARRVLARLRRSFTGGRQEAEAYDVVFPHDPPLDEQELWLLVAGLFALHPQNERAKGRSIGGAMQLLVDERPSAARRFTQLLSVDSTALPHYLRQAIQLLRSDDIALDYHRLLSDLAEMQSSREKAHSVRLRWAREYYRRQRQGRTENAQTAGGEDGSDAATESTDPHQEIS